MVVHSLPKLFTLDSYSNLALCHALLGQFEEATEYWKKFLTVAIEQGDTAAQGQAYYCLGTSLLLVSS